MLIRCHYCSREKPAWRVHHLGKNAQAICDYCLDWHDRALNFLAGRAMPGCQECGATWEILRDRTPDVEERVRMFVVPKDGIYGLLCADCLTPYVKRRRDLYGGTSYGARVLN